MRKGFVGIAVSVLTSPAAADWQYTRWGMTPQQVVAASRGQAKPFSGPDATRDPAYKTLLTSPFAADQHRFTAHFIFNAANKLIRVSLKMEGGDCSSLSFALRSQYGEFVRGIPWRWRDERRKNNVAYHDWGGGSCIVEYWAFDGTGGRL